MFFLKKKGLWVLKLHEYIVIGESTKMKQSACVENRGVFEEKRSPKSSVHLIIQFLLIAHEEVRTPRSGMACPRPHGYLDKSNGVMMK